jgi:hypothetical protein
LFSPSPSVSKPFITMTSSRAGRRGSGGSMMKAP